ncbi:MAG: hypothetical protein KatS3mg088_628 [Patescibacteria group bacterium]|nr:MAG: hypothetical protein KatS3mg088_628 [Patescibacteria group bacterium]
MQDDINQKAQKAIDCAIEGNWNEALRINKEILEENPNDIEALGRLARAYSEIGDIKNAKATAKKVLSLDPYNLIAKKCLEKWNKLKPKGKYVSQSVNADLFIEEPGRTKIVNLTYPGNPKTIAKLDAGDKVKLDAHGHRINVTTLENEYIGRLPDDINSRLKKLIKLGNQYQAFVKSAEGKEIKIFIREIKKTKKTEKIPSFAVEKIDYVSFTPPELVHHKEDYITSEPDEPQE